MEIQEFIATLPNGACRPCGKGMYSLVARTTLGDVSAEQLNVINDVVQEFGLPGLRVTGRQQVQLLNIPQDKLKAVVERIGEVGTSSKYFVQACPGSKACRLGVQDSMAMGRKLEKLLNSYTLPSKLKSSVSGCSMSCAESYVRDVGLVGSAKGWTVLFGGNAGKGVRKGDVLATGVDGEEAFKIIGKALYFYAENTKKKERTARFVDRVGIEAVLEAVNAS
jgi:NAD(P)H-nitrite reductase large subunit